MYTSTPKKTEDWSKIGSDVDTAPTFLQITILIKEIT